MDNCKINQPGWRSNASYMPYRNNRQSMSVSYPRETCPDRQNMCRGKNQDSMINMPVAMAYVPWQFYTETFDLCKALHVGTIFPELCLPFCGTRRKCR
ncbi:MAG: spore coat associated protein CotJA [Lachnospiraceae bacterium]|jgi:hypothetical protein